MDKITCIAYLLYESSVNPDIKDKAIQLLNGDITVRDLKRNTFFQAHIILAESLIKKNKIDKLLVQQFAEQFMSVEI